MLRVSAVQNILTYLNRLVNFKIKKKTSSVYDCTVEDVEYICNSNKL